MSEPKTLELICYGHDPSGETPLMLLTLSLDSINRLIEKMLRASDAKKCDEDYQHGVYRSFQRGHYVDLLRMNLDGADADMLQDSLWEVADSCLKNGTWEYVHDIVEVDLPWPPESYPTDMIRMHVSPDSVHWKLRPKHASYDLTTESVSKTWLHEMQKMLLLAETENISG
mgnify:FL=1